MQTEKRELFPIHLEVIEHHNQRYDTVGDWEWVSRPLPEPSNDVVPQLVIRVSRLADWRYMFLIGAHELIEVALCYWANVTQEEVDAFDLAFEAKREPGNEDEPGDDPSAPYYRQHQTAEICERIIAAFMCVKWCAYMAALQELDWNAKRDLEG